MIRTHDTSPQQALALAIGGTIAGPSTIVVGSRLVTVSPLGVVRVDGVRIGRWSEPTGVLAARYAATGAVAHV
jgi:hypothetical protein